MFLLTTSPIYADSCDDIPATPDKIQDKITCLEKKTADLVSQSKTLSNQIAQFNSKILVTELKVQQTQDKIDLLSGRIDQLDVSLKDLTKAFSNRALATYKMARSNEPIFLLLSAQSLSELSDKFHYLQKIQLMDRDFMIRLTYAQNTYKQDKSNQEQLEKELQQEKNDLNVQKRSKAQLLISTQNDEKKYQSLLNQALAEKAAIERALVSGVQVGPVKKGDPIALMGNSGYPGCSTGKHLHFEVRKNGSWTDPTAYLTNKSVINDQDGTGNVSIGSGNWDWPISDTIRVTQFYGHTPYSYVYTYSGGIHTGIDMVSTGGDIIRAPADGTLFKSSQACSGSTINIVYIDHGSGVVSLYLHVQ